MAGPNRTLALAFGRGTGKSFIQRQIWYTLISGYGRIKPVRIILLTPTFKQAVDSFSQLMANELTTMWAHLGGEINRTRWRVDFPGGSWIQFFGAENADSARGMRADMISVDECDDIDPSVYDAVAIPWLSEPWSLKMRVLSGTPRRGRYGLLYRTFRKAYELDLNGERKFPDHYAIQASYLDTPEVVSKEYVESVRLSMPKALFEREWLASFESSEGLVYPFDERVHVVKPDDAQQWTEVLVGVDWGWSDPGVFVAIGILGTGRDARAHIIDEVHQPEQVIGWWADRAREWSQKYPGARWFADPSQPAAIETLKREAHIDIKPSIKHKIEDGVGLVANMLAKRPTPGSKEHQPRLFVAPRCENTVREMLLYRRKKDPRDPERHLEAIEDKNNHCNDAVRYALFSRFGKPASGRTDFGPERFGFG